MRTFRLFLLVTLAAAAWVGAFGAPSGAASSYGVEIKDRAYSPKNLEVTIGDTVVWTNLDDEEHTVTFTDGVDSNPGCPGLLTP